MTTEKQESGFWQPGKHYLVRTVTMIDIGTLVSIDDHEVVLKNVAWVADTKRWMESVRESDFNEVEPFPTGALVAIGRGAIVDAVQVSKLALEQR